MKTVNTNMHQFVDFLHRHTDDIIGFNVGVIGGNILLSHIGLYDAAVENLWKVLLGIPVSIILGVAGMLGKDLYIKYIQKWLK